MTKVKLACMTLPYMNHSFERALEGIARAGYQYIAFGLDHAGQEIPDEDDDRAATALQHLFEQYKVQPVMLIGNRQFAPGQPVERIRKRLQIARLLGIEEIISVGTYGYQTFPNEPRAGDEMKSLNAAFVQQFQKVAVGAEVFERTITIKPHTGNTATAAHILETLEQIGSPYVKASYDPGNVQFYEGVNAAEDFKLIADRTYSIIAKDHRGQRAELDFPVPGSGDVDFLNIFQTARAAGFCGNVVVERIDGPDDAESIDERIAEAQTALRRLLGEAGLEVEG